MAILGTVASEPFAYVVVFPRGRTGRTDVVMDHNHSPTVFRGHEAVLHAGWVADLFDGSEVIPLRNLPKHVPGWSILPE